jgi:hypothetical protein
MVWSEHPHTGLFCQLLVARGMLLPHRRAVVTVGRQEEVAAARQRLLAPEVRDQLDQVFGRLS